MVDLGTAGSFAILAGSTVTNTGPTVINGDLGLSPGTSVTGFPPGIVNGTQQITNAAAAQAEADLGTAYNAASGQSVGTVSISGDLGGQTLTPGLYNSASSLGLTGTLTLDGQGNPNAVFIFQIGSALTTASGSRVNLVNGAQACNVVWQIGSSATLGTNSIFKGTILALTSATLTTGAAVEGRVLARNGAVTLDTSVVSKATCAVAAAVTPTPATTTVAIVPVVTVSVVVPTATTTIGASTPVTTFVPAAAFQAVVPALISTGTAVNPPVATSVQAPGSPNTGTGGNASDTFLILSLSEIVVVGGFAYLLSFARRRIDLV
ncbi:MAG: ice-binding family protein [Candidatus Paceibacterota bacterium]